MNVKVAIRMRPPNEREQQLGYSDSIVQFTNDNSVLIRDPAGKVDDHHFTFDFAFDSSDNASTSFADQEHVFECTCDDILSNTLEGYNGCILAYGQTGAGKSYTMMGDPSDSTNKGLIPRLLESLFLRIGNLPPSELVSLECSYMEIYNEKVFDLLDKDGGRHSPLAVRDSKAVGPFVKNLTSVTVDDVETVHHLIDQGNMLRHISSTAMNATSSRSHAMFQLNVKISSTDQDRKTIRTSRLNLVDLAGSERQKKTNATGAALREGAAINKSLSTLGLVISELVKKSHHGKVTGYIPYRDSTLTWLLKENFGGNSRTSMIAAISPSADNYDETLSTLRYANRAKQIVNKAVINESAPDKLVRELREHITELEAKLQDSLSNGMLHGEIVQCQEDIEAHEQLLRREVTAREVKLAQATKLLEETTAKLEANREVLNRVLSQGHEAETALKAALRAEHAAHDEVADLKQQNESLGQQLADATRKHMQYAASIEPQMSMLRQQVMALEDELAKTKTNSEDLYPLEEKSGMTDSNTALSRSESVAERFDGAVETAKLRAAETSDREAQLETENSSLQDELRKAIEREEIALANAREQQSKVANLESHVAKLKAELMADVDTKWASSEDPTFFQTHLVKPSAIREATRAAVTEGDNIKAAFEILAKDRERELKRTVKNLESRLAQARMQESVAVQRASGAL